MAKDIIVERVIELSQQEGLNDTEIGEVLGYARGSVQRIRKLNNIPTAKKENRMDKEVTCLKCGKAILLRRKDDEKKIFLCDTCLKEDGAKINKLLNDKVDE